MTKIFEFLNVEVIFGNYIFKYILESINYF